MSRIDAYLGSDTLLSKRIALGKPLSRLIDAKPHPSKPAAAAMAKTPGLDHVEAVCVGMFLLVAFRRSVDVVNDRWALPDLAATVDKRAATEAAVDRPNGLAALAK
jgi:hypothetical protein